MERRTGGGGGGKRTKAYIERQSVLVERALDWEPGDLSVIFGSATDRLCDLEQVTPCGDRDCSSLCACSEHKHNKALILVGASRCHCNRNNHGTGPFPRHRSCVTILQSSGKDSPEQTADVAIEQHEECLPSLGLVYPGGSMGGTCSW